jgi:hypothetical protein
MRSTQRVFIGELEPDERNRCHGEGGREEEEE